MTDHKNDAERNPWKVVSSRSIYRNPWFSVREDQVIRPDGKPGTYSVVEPKIATGIVALDDNGDTWLVGQYRYPIDIYSWEIIEGGVDPGETPLEAAVRELKEEGGLVAEEIVPLGPAIYLSNCFTSERGELFLARGITTGEAQPEGTEVLQLRKMPFSEALEMARTGAISDVVSIIALERAARFLEQENRS